MVTIKSINAAIAALGGEEKLDRTKDAFYFYDGHADMWYTSVVSVYRLNHLTLDEWIERYKNLRDDPRNAHLYQQEIT